MTTNTPTPQQIGRMNRRELDALLDSDVELEWEQNLAGFKRDLQMKITKVLILALSAIIFFVSVSNLIQAHH